MPPASYDVGLYAELQACHAGAQLLSGSDAAALAAYAQLLSTLSGSFASPPGLFAPPGLAPRSTPPAEASCDELSERACASSCDSSSTCAPEDASVSELPVEGEKPVTTLMIRNLPNRYSQSKLIEELKLLGLEGTFDFLYVPLASATLVNVGYAFLNFKQPCHAAQCMKLMDGRKFSQQRRDKKVAAVSVARVQGFAANVRHYERAVSKSCMVKQRRPFMDAPQQAQECS